MRLFSCLAGSKSVTLSWVTKIIVSGSVDLLETSYQYIILSFKSLDYELFIKFQQSGFGSVTVLVYDNKNNIYEIFNVNTWNESEQFTLPVDTKITVAGNKATLYLEVKEYTKILRTYQKAYNLARSITGTVTVTLYRLATDESYCSDFTIEYETLSTEFKNIMAIIPLVISISMFTTVIGLLKIMRERE